MSKVNTHFGLICWLLGIFIVSAQAKDICRNLGPCHICYTPSYSQSGGTMNECSYKVCQKYKQTGKEDRQCVEFETRYYDERECLSNCCKDVTRVNYFAVSEIDKCREYYRLLPACIVCGIVYGLALVAFSITFIMADQDSLGGIGKRMGIFLCCSCYIFHKKLWRPQQNKVQKHREQEPTAQETLLHLEWQVDTDGRSEFRGIREDPNFQCTVCTYGAVNTVTSRNKFYHLSCIYNQVRRENESQSITENEIEWVRYYCPSCGRQYCEITAAELKKWSYESLFESMKNPTCPNCST